MEDAQIGARPISKLDTIADLLRQILEWPGRFSVYIGATSIVLMLAITVADVVLRNLFAQVVPGSLELIGLLTILVTLSAIGVVEMERNHIQVDLVLRALPEWLRLPTLAGDLMITLMIVVVTAYQMVGQANYLSSNNIVTGVLELPQWPFVAAAALFMALMAVALVANLLSALSDVFKLDDGRAIGSLLLWVIIAAFITYTCFSPDLLQSSFDRKMLGLVSITLCFVLIFLGVHTVKSAPRSALLNGMRSLKTAFLRSPK